MYFLQEFETLVMLKGEVIEHKNVEYLNKVAERVGEHGLIYVALKLPYIEVRKHITSDNILFLDVTGRAHEDEVVVSFPRFTSLTQIHIALSKLWQLGEFKGVVLDSMNTLTNFYGKHNAARFLIDLAQRCEQRQALLLLFNDGE
jgi:hypothetical protein